MTAKPTDYFPFFVTLYTTALKWLKGYRWLGVREAGPEVPQAATAQTDMALVRLGYLIPHPLQPRYLQQAPDASKNACSSNGT